MPKKLLLLLVLVGLFSIGCQKADDTPSVPPLYDEATQINDPILVEALVEKYGFEKEHDRIFSVNPKNTQLFKSITELDLSNLDLTSLAGIKVFSALKKLDASKNKLTSAAFSAFSELEHLNISHNSFTDFINKVDLKNNKKLKYFDCSYNQIDFVFVYSPVLEHLDCSNNKMMRLGEVPSAKLAYMDCSNNTIDGLGVENFSALGYFDCSNNPKLYTLILPESGNLKELNCSNTPIREHLINLELQTKLVRLDCSKSNLFALNVLPCVDLEQLNCAQNDLFALNISTLPKLKVGTDFKCGEQKNNNSLLLHINEIHVAQWNTIKSNPENVLVKLAPFKEEYAITDPTLVTLLVQMLSFEVENGKIHYNNPANYNIFNRRTRLDISSKGLTSLEGIEYFESLEFLSCERNKISEINLSLIPNLKSLDCYGNGLTALDVSVTTRLHSLRCGDQKNSGGLPQKLTLTLRADQQDFWSTQKSNYYNGVSVETNILP